MPGQGSQSLAPPPVKGNDTDIEGALVATGKGRPGPKFAYRSLLEIPGNALLEPVEDEDAVAAALLKTGRDGKAADLTTVGADRGNVEVEVDVAAGNDEFPGSPGVAQVEAELDVQQHRGLDGARGYRNGGEELALRGPRREPPALPSRMDQ
jgi:hypothetical protein